MGGLEGIRYSTVKPAVAYTPFKDDNSINCDPAQLKQATWEDVLTGALAEMYGNDFIYMPKPIKDQLVKDLADAYTAEASRSRGVTDRSASNAALPFNYNFDAWYKIGYQSFDSTHCGAFSWLPQKYGTPPKVELNTVEITSAADRALEAAKPVISAATATLPVTPGVTTTVIIEGNNFIPNHPYPADGRATQVSLGKTRVTPVVSDDLTSITATLQIGADEPTGIRKLVVTTRYGQAEFDFVIGTAQTAPEPALAAPPAVAAPRRTAAPAPARPPVRPAQPAEEDPCVKNPEACL